MSDDHETPSLRLVALADLAGRGDAKTGRIPVDKERFDEALAAISPRLVLSLPNRLGIGERTLDLDLRFRRFADLTPAGLAEQIPALTRLRDAHALVEELERGTLSVESFRERAAGVLPEPLAEEIARRARQPERAAPATGTEAGPEPTRSQGEAVDAILELVDTKGLARSTSQETARRLVDELTARPSRPPGVDRAGLAGLRAELAARLSAQLDEVLAAPAFRALEASWRGLKLLVDRSDFRKPIAIDLVSATLDEAPAAIDSLQGDDVDLVVADYELDASERDLERAQALAAAGERTQTPVVVAVAPAFLGVGSWRELTRGRDPSASFSEPRYSDWRSFREAEASRWLVLVANRIALRAAYGDGGEPARGLPYSQPPERGLLGSSVWALASVLTRAFERTGACLQFTGARHGLVPDLALLPLGAGDPLAPVEGVFANERREDLEKIGLTAIQLYQRDVALVGPARAFHRPERYPDPEASADAAQQVTLAYQIFASRLVKFLGRAVPSLIGLEGSEAVQGELRSQVLRFVSTPEHPLRADHVGINLQPNPDDASLTDVALRLQPEFTIGGRPVNVLLHFTLRI